MKDEIIKELNLIRPSLQAHNGDVEFIDFDKKTGTLKVKLTGACNGCPMAALTLKQGIEEHLKNKLKEIKKIESV